MDIYESEKKRDILVVKNMVVIGNAAQIVAGVVKLQVGGLIGTSDKIDVTELAVRRLVARIDQKKVA